MCIWYASWKNPNTIGNNLVRFFLFWGKNGNVLYIHILFNQNERILFRCSCAFAIREKQRRKYLLLEKALAEKKKIFIWKKKKRQPICSAQNVRKNDYTNFDL